MISWTCRWLMLQYLWIDLSLVTVNVTFGLLFDKLRLHTHTGMHRSPFRTVALHLKALTCDCFDCSSEGARFMMSWQQQEIRNARLSHRPQAVLKHRSMCLERPVLPPSVMMKRSERTSSPSPTESDWCAQSKSTTPSAVMTTCGGMCFQKERRVRGDLDQIRNVLFIADLGALSWKSVVAYTPHPTPSVCSLDSKLRGHS